MLSQKQSFLLSHREISSFTVITVISPFRYSELRYVPEHYPDLVYAHIRVVMTAVPFLKAIPHNSCVRIAQSDFFVRVHKFDAGRLAPFKENLCAMTENMQVDDAQRR